MAQTGDRHPPPRDLEGFEAFEAAGLTPARPTSPPPVASGITARGALRRLALVAGSSVAIAVATLLLLPKDEGSLPPSTLAAFLSVVAVGVVASWWALVAFRKVLLRELQAGYVTTTFEQGVFWVQRDFGLNKGVVGWDWNGVWVLRPTGEVLSSPGGDGDPPGVYPSPHAAGRRELWTGYRWTKFFTD